MQTFFLILLALLVYVFFAYPAALMLCGLFARRPRPVRDFPSVAVLIAARNERTHIARKIRNTLAFDYPAERMEIFVASDGSRDGTAACLRRLHHPRIHILTFDEPVGKTNAVNRMAEQTEAEILVMSDADVTVSPDAVRRLAAHFSDPRVGAVCGRRSDAYEQPSGARWPARLYNLYESSIKRGEGALGRVLGADGCLYAVRRACFRPLPAGVPDDFVAVLRVLREGRRVRYDSRAVSREEIPDTAAWEFSRRRRTVARGVRGLWSVRALLHPFRFPLVSFMLVSHKLLRWSAGIFLFGLLIVNAALIHVPPFGAWFGAQTIFYLCGVLGACPVEHGFWKPLRVVRYFVLANAAAAAGLLDVVCRRDWTTWDARPRPARKPRA